MRKRLIVYLFPLPPFSLASQQAPDEADHEDHEKDEEQDLGDLRGAGSHSTEAEHGGDQGNDEKNCSPVQHEVSFRSDAALKQGATRLRFFSAEQQTCQRGAGAEQGICARRREGKAESVKGSQNLPDCW